MIEAGRRLDPATIAAYEKEFVLHTWSAQKTYSPWVITKARGSSFWDDSGKKYLDFASQLINVNVGHQHPKITQAIKDQADRLCYVIPSAANEQRALLGKLLSERAPEGLSKAFFVTGGGVANENALKIARTVTGRQKVISRFRSYHGATYGASSVTGDPRGRAVEPGVPGSIRVWDPFCYRCFFKMTYPECDLYCAEAIREVIEVEGPKSVAALIVEPITGSNGRIVPPQGYMQRLRRICDDYGMLLIYDEVMTGFGRTGRWFAADHWDAVPDIMTLSKGINNGALPLGAVLLRKNLAEYFDSEILYTGLTQFGNPVACAAAVATIQVMEEEGLIENSRTLGGDLLEALQAIQDRHPSIGDVRGLGLFAAIDFVKDRQTREPIVPWTIQGYENKSPIMQKLLIELKEGGLYAYSRWNTLFICPPLCITKEELDWGLEKIDEAVALVDAYVDVS
jgi:taurine--2-oxoglutarate transaminase